jgi:hypothetical protein
MIIPLYSPPGPDWNLVVSEKQANPTLTFLVIINPVNGPGPDLEQTYGKNVTTLEHSGALVFGYVHTDLGRGDTSSVESEIRKYKSWYNVDGIFFDGMPTVSGYEAYYSAVGSFARTLGLFNVGNPGTTIPQSYAGILDLYVLDESPAPLASSGPIPASETASLIYGVRAINQTFVDSFTRLSGFVHVTDRNQPDPYISLPTYFSSLVYMLAVASSTVQSLSTAPNQPSSSTAAPNPTPTVPVFVFAGVLATSALLVAVVLFVGPLSRVIAGKRRAASNACVRRS